MPLFALGAVVLIATLLLIAISNGKGAAFFSKPKSSQGGHGAQRPSNVQYEKSEDGKIVYIFRDKSKDAEAEVAPDGGEKPDPAPDQGAEE